MSLHEKGLCVARSLISESIAIFGPPEHFNMFCAYFEGSASERGIGKNFCVEGQWNPIRAAHRGLSIQNPANHRGMPFGYGSCSDLCLGRDILCV